MNEFTPEGLEKLKKQLGFLKTEKRQEIEMRNQRQRDFVSSFSMIMVGLPLYLYHWTIIKKEV